MTAVCCPSVYMWTLGCPAGTWEWSAGAGRPAVLQFHTGARQGGGMGAEGTEEKCWWREGVLAHQVPWNFTARRKKYVNWVHCPPADPRVTFAEEDSEAHLLPAAKSR